MSDPLVLFEDCHGRPVPRLRRAKDGSIRECDGVRYMSATQAAAHFGWTEDDLFQFWRDTWDDVLLRDYQATLLEPPPLPADSGIELARLDVLYQQRFASDLSREQFDMLVEICQQRRLNVWANQVYARTQHNDRTGRPELLVILGLNGLRLIAQRTALYAGCDRPKWEPSDDPRHPSMCTFTVYKMVRGTRQPFEASALWDECAPEPGISWFWDQRPYEALELRAEAKALRKAFTEEVGDLYDPDEVRRDRGDDRANRGGRRRRHKGRPMEQAAPNPTNEEELPTTRISFEIAARSLGYDDKRRPHLIAVMRSKFPVLLEQDESEFWKRAYQELLRNPRAYGQPGTA